MFMYDSMAGGDVQVPVIRMSTNGVGVNVSESPLRNVVRVFAASHRVPVNGIDASLAEFSSVVSRET